ncbi:probable nucleoredoxin 1 [Amaranthus tricolor]|uniref:probable nucleoredoxin 1 n=1 Tax=Amaranthus tricolor TaxID=29722 RepID=UPI0025838283|nr:probable nucleoredoxin 1 [Amaranthus tricolor]
MEEDLDMVPEELKVMNREKLVEYMFPCCPVAAWDKDILSERLHGIGEEQSPTVDDPVFVQVRDVSAKLKTLISDEIWKECNRMKSKSRVIVGKRYDLKKWRGFLNRGDGRKVEAAKYLKGKYILICSFNVPIYWDCCAWELSMVCRELYSKLNNKFEMVIVPKMRRGWSTDERAFHHFISGFPSSCLSIPFQDQRYRYRVCKALGEFFECRIVLVSRTGTVLLNSSLDNAFERILPSIGADPRPFPSINGVKFQHLKKTPLSLEKSLGSDFLFKDGKQVPISLLKSKPVALYLYETGELLGLLRKVEEACRRNYRELEIVIVYVPWKYSGNPWKFTKLLVHTLAELCISWWVAPFNSTASITLGRFFGRGYPNKVVIVGPNGEYVDPCGAEIMKLFGIHAHPFTLEGVVSKILNKLRKVTLDSFFKGMPCENLRGKNVLLYFDYPYNVYSYVYEAFIRLDHSCSDMEVLPCSLASAEEVESCCRNSSYNFKVHVWYYNDDVSKKFFLRFFKRVFRTIVAFGKDGRICSVLAHRLPTPCGDEAFEIGCNLREEVSKLLGDLIAEYILYGGLV